MAATKEIMIVDDEQPYRNVLRKALEKRGGYEVIEASSGRDCFKVLKTEHPDLMLIDIMMPGMDGWEVCKKIKEDDSTKDIKVITLSVRKGEEDRLKSLTYSKADMHIEKSLGFDVILKTIEWLFEIAAAEERQEPGI